MLDDELACADLNFRTSEFVTQYGEKLVSGYGETDLVIRGGFPLRVVDGILTGVHEIGESHFRLLEAFTPRITLESALRIAEQEGYLTHEFGDSCLIL